MKKLLKKVAASVVAVGLAASGVAQAGAQDLRSVIESPHVNKCSPEFLITVPGGANTASFFPEKLATPGKATDVAKAVYHRTGGTVQPVWITYPAVPFMLMPYNDSARAGYNVAASTIHRLSAMCPDATFSFTGYSEGAGIGAQLVNNIAHGRGPIPANKMSSAAFVSNPHLADNGGAFGGGATKTDRGALEILPGGYGQVGNRVLDVCRVDDPVCSLPGQWRVHVDPALRIAALRGRIPVTELILPLIRKAPETIPFIMTFFNHGQYGSGMTNQAAQWIIDRKGSAS